MRKNWLITGISSGLGQALAKQVMDSGDFVIGTFRKQTQVDAFNESHVGKGRAILLDITHLDEIDRLVQTLIDDHNRIDVLVNNAGVGFVGAVEEASINEVRNVFEVNFFGTLKMTQAVLPYMRQARNGHVIQISSHGGIKAFAGFGIYNASKFALEGFSEALAQEVSPLGIRISIVEPGPFRTQFAGNGLMGAKAAIADYVETAGAFRIKLKGVDGRQEGNPHKAAQAIFNLAGSDSNSLRLPLGKTALMTIGMKLDSVKSDLEANRAVAENSVF